MARLTIAVAMLAVALLVTGQAAAAQTGNRKLLAANAVAAGQGTASGEFAKAGSFQNTNTFNNALASAGIAGGASYGVSIKNGKPSISTAIGEGTTLSTGGKSTSQASVNAQSSKNPGTSAGEYINVGSSKGGAATSAIAAAQALGK